MIKFLFGFFTADFLVTTLVHLGWERHNWSDGWGILSANISMIFFATLLFLQHYEVYKIE